MTLLEYAKKLFAKGPELWEDTVVTEDPTSKTKIKRDTAKLRRCSLGIVSCETAAEWYLVVRREAPVSTVMVPYEDDKDAWDELFSTNRVLVRADITRSMLQERASKSARTLLDVMERRDPERWAKDPKKLEVSTPDGSSELKITLCGI